MGVSIVITSGKGGVGKTTTTANLGTALASIGKKVVVVDGDTGLRNLDVLMGLENRIVYTIIDVIENRCRLKQALIKDKRFPNLHLLPTAQSKDKDDIKTNDMLKIIKELKEEFDYVLIDSPAGIERGFENAAIGADRAIVVVNPEITSIRDADRVIGKLDAKGICDHSVIVNRLNYEMAQRGDMLGVNDIIEVLSVELLGVVPDDKRVSVSTNKGEPIVLDEQSKTGMAFKNIAKRITGENIPIMEFTEESTGFFGTIMKLFKRK
ncbi:septum site-determining protein MinD [Clostridium thermobutyricum]|uniref:Septum site-determining protein MinD n=2 Tax=Clostridium thermobutyricum TaxID=29372 RepID=N9Y0E0_9CLOT|nr:septum site-determining protein MinD [Clostridium thermobutyricum]ENZ01292.1 septum site-determining protein MinD [Clostridium thermobutyricum]OPX49217.1 septum site-determining protein MinD [Clostridium thermobutyricum DSM 4928]